MSTKTETGAETAQHRGPRPGAGTLPTAPCSVVWSKGHAYVLEGFRARWVGVDDRGRPQVLSAADLQRRGWSRTR
ncbi:hypothetical protein [Saccharothrix coeruleofusca]|uniref:Uncharacterized protein n=1 Tax=Saccharothrix coeruleofusca TaxID=33919 RepID=A0A918AP54_9PSEU|nr:hypothetical protein [Saccharothrix coeruleofusca]MBP2337964.1 ABC-type bacteriocin/lantibiotic exporter with double-glycine peptidase domain [Saccharothrix coeruleofusca]GGP63398.1 hypothetical protein GCM10010185_40100 [Saccharothrix coeruleofusca]